MPPKRVLAAGLLMVASVAAILLPLVSATLLTLALAGVAFSAGVGQFLRLAGSGDDAAKVLWGLSGVIYCAAALWVVIDPIDSAISLTLLAGVVLLGNGVMELAAAASTSGAAGVVTLLDGLITSLLGVLLVLEWPSDSVWALGTLFGVGLFLTALNLMRSRPALTSED